MKTFFYDRTAYKLSNEPVPNCFFMLDDHFDARFNTAHEAYTHRSVLLAEMVCGRIADVEMYAFLIADACKRHAGLEYAGSADTDIERLTHDRQSESGKGAILLRSFLFGYLASCRALLNVAAMALAELYALPLPAVQQRFDNGDFWHELVVNMPNVHRRYHSQRLFFNEVIRWQDEAVNRIPPIALLQGHLSRQGMQLQVIDEPIEKLGSVTREPHLMHWIDALELHTRWKPRLLSLCEKICHDIEVQT